MLLEIEKYSRLVMKSCSPDSTPRFIAQRKFYNSLNSFYVYSFVSAFIPLNIYM